MATLTTGVFVDVRFKSFHGNRTQKLFSDNKPCQLWMKAQRFGDHPHFHHQGKDVKHFVAREEFTEYL
jgi:hypothetical protein